MKIEVKKIIDATEQIKQKQLTLDTLDAIITDITDSTDSNGDIELQITRTKKMFSMDATSITNKLTAKRNAVGAQIDALVAKITLNG